MKKTTEIALRDRLELIVDSQGKKEAIIDAVTREYGARIPELLEDAICSAETTDDFLKIVDRVKDISQIPKPGDNAAKEGAQIATAAIVAALRGIGDIVDSKA